MTVGFRNGIATPLGQEGFFGGIGSGGSGNNWLTVGLVANAPPAQGMGLGYRIGSFITDPLGTPVATRYTGCDDSRPIFTRWIVNTTVC